jgi:hypothetical protein
MAKFCSECGKPILREGSPFCSECGAKIPSTPPIEQKPGTQPVTAQQPVQAPPPATPPPQQPVQALQSQRAYSINYVLFFLLIVGIFLIVINAETWLVLVVLGACAIAVYYDAVAINAGKSAEKQYLLQPMTYKPISWAVLTFLLLPLFLSLYLYKREAIFRQNTGPQQPVQVLPAFTPSPQQPGISTPDIGGVKSSIQHTTLEDFTEIRKNINDFKRAPYSELIGPVGGVILLISLFCIWVDKTYCIQQWDYPKSCSYYQFNLFYLDKIIANIALWTALASIGSVFFARRNARGLVQLGMGIVALITLLVGGLHIIQNYTDVSPATARATTVIAGAGPYVYLLATIVIIYGGIRILHKKGDRKRD